MKRELFARNCGPMKIRAATVSDAEVIARFNALLARETEAKELSLDRVRPGVEAILRDATKGLYFVAENEGTVIGQVMITYEWSDWRNGTFWWLQSVFVDENFRGKGIFKKLFAHVHSLAKQRTDVCGIRLYVERENHRAQSAYSKLGMITAPYHLFEIDFTSDQ